MDPVSRDAGHDVDDDEDEKDHVSLNRREKERQAIKLNGLRWAEEGIYLLAPCGGLHFTKTTKQPTNHSFSVDFLSNRRITFSLKLKKTNAIY